MSPVLSHLHEMFADKVAAAGLPPDVALELILANLQEQVSGSDSLGYRVVAPGLDGLSAFVVLERGSYRIVCVSNQRESLGSEALRRLAAQDLAGARQWLDWAREVVGEPAGDLPSPPFAALWTRGDPADEAAMRCAAAALAFEDDPAPSIDMLRACRSAATSDDRRLAFDLALTLAYEKAKRWKEMGEAAERLAAARPAAERPFRLQTSAARRETHRVAGATELVRERLSRYPDDLFAADLQAVIDQSAGRFDDAEQRLRKTLDNSAAGPQEQNFLAWLMLVRGRVDEQALDLAQRAAQKAANPSILHTLAAILAERDRPKEAYQVILQAIKARSDQIPQPADYYVFGRIAEQLGRPDAARPLYRLVKLGDSDEESDPATTYRLAQRRLKALESR